MWIRRVDGGVQASGDAGDHQIGKRDFVPLRGELAPEIGGCSPVIPVDLSVVRKTKT